MENGLLLVFHRQTKKLSKIAISSGGEAVGNATLGKAVVVLEESRFDFCQLRAHIFAFKRDVAPTWKVFQRNCRVGCEKQKKKKTVNTSCQKHASILQDGSRVVIRIKTAMEH